MNRSTKLFQVMLTSLVASFLLACASPTPVPPPPPLSLARTLVFYNWADYMPQAVLDTFAAEYGVQITYLTYNSQEEAVAKIKAGQVFDLAVVENDHVRELVADGLLAELDYHNVPNFKNISPNFRDLLFDPGNKHAVPYGWGTTGLLVRTDLIQEPITRWADLWDKRYAGKIVLRAQPTELITIALKSLGYAINSEQPAELDAALKRLIALKHAVHFVEVEGEQAVTPLLDGKAVILVGWPGDALLARRQNPNIRYILPEGDTILWGDSFVISAHSPHKATAELFLNFLLRPAIGAQIVNGNRYAIANEAARPLINPEIANNSLIYPPNEILAKGKWYLPLSPAGEKLYLEIWQRFMSTP